MLYFQKKVIFILFCSPSTKKCYNLKSIISLRWIFKSIAAKSSTSKNHFKIIKDIIFKEKFNRVIIIFLLKVLRNI